MHKTEIKIPSREDILAVLRQAQAPLTREQVYEHLKLSEDQVPIIEKRLNAMERDGQLMPNRKGMLLLSTKLDFVAGKVAGHRDGFGFLIRDDRGPDAFLSPREMQKVLHGDRVLVRITGTDHRGKPEGTIVEVTERKTNRLVGRLVSERGILLVIPEDQRIKHDILVSPKDVGNATPGKVVTVEIIEQPTRHSQPIGKVAEVLGELDDPGMEIEIAVRKFDVPYEFNLLTMNQAESIPSEVEHKDLKGRVDLRDVPFVTIDGEDARDFDDAVYCTPSSDTKEGWRLLVAIADVSHYVLPGTPIDQEATKRGTSVYFPRRVIPMLPEKLSNGLCSLNPGVDRLVLVCDMIIGPKGAIKAYQFYNGVIHSAARLTYNQVWDALTDSQSMTAKAMGHVYGDVENLYTLFKVLFESRQRRGAMEIDTVETQVMLDPDGKIDKIVAKRRNDAHRLIEECMLAANVCAADFLERSKHPSLYRVHEGPTVEKLQNLRTFLRSVALTLDGGDDPTSLDYANLMKKIQGRPDQALLQTMMLRSMQQAIYTPHNSGHFGLAYPAYAHFTSPIRRYPDLMVHRSIKALLGGKRYVPMPLDEREFEDYDPKRKVDKAEEISRWDQSGNWFSSTERRADEASRDVMSWLKCFFMKERVGDTFQGHVSGVTSFGLFITLDALYVEGLVHVSELGTEYFQYSDSLHELRGERSGIRYRLTDAINVQVSRVDLDARRIEFRLVQGVKFESLMREPAKPNGRAGNRPQRQQGRRTNTAQMQAAVQDAGKTAPVLPPEENSNSRGVNKKRAADESRSKAAAEKKRKEEIQKAKRVSNLKPATGSKMRTAAKKPR
ncbi:ribonuclease R [Limnobacter parvus]|uniref:Ribonuclease R n=1 Tax=Limnobacter parvus TaxID=2939690 RepID=A0ABT1XFF8_9BURK|nr:ribonuclease R [Limnobacter parvus]MCR2746015.1 ribonuclease R [Limnobacter parvus]